MRGGRLKGYPPIPSGKRIREGGELRKKLLTRATFNAVTSTRMGREGREAGGLASTLFCKHSKGQRRKDDSIARRPSLLRGATH